MGHRSARRHSGDQDESLAICDQQGRRHFSASTSSASQGIDEWQWLNICRQEEDAGGKKGESDKKARSHGDEDADQSSEHDPTADPDCDEDDTEVEAGDDGDDEMRNPQDPKERHRKEEEVTVNIPNPTTS